jgi:hypothetical protein
VQWCRGDVEVGEIPTPPFLHRFRWASFVFQDEGCRGVDDFEKCPSGKKKTVEVQHTESLKSPNHLHPYTPRNEMQKMHTEIGAKMAV